MQHFAAPIRQFNERVLALPVLVALITIDIQGNGN